MTIALTFSYTGAVEPVTIQWFKDGTPLVDGPSGGATVAGATTTSLLITGADLTWEGSYHATVTDALGCTQTTADYPVNLECTIHLLSQPEDQTPNVGDNVNVAFTYGGGTGPFTIQWFLNGVLVVDGPTGHGSTISGATTETLTITNIQEDDFGTYQAVLTDEGQPDCQITTATAFITNFECMDLLYYDFETVVTGGGGSSYENQQDNRSYFNMGVLPSPPPAPSVIPGIIGDGVVIGTGGVDAVSLVGTDTAVGPAANCLNMYERSWTMRMWINGPGPFGGIALEAGIYRAAVRQNIDPAFPDPILNRVAYEIIGVSGGSPYGLTGVEGPIGDPTLNSWHRFILAYDIPTRTLRWKLNNNAYTTIAAPSDFTLPSSSYVFNVLTDDGDRRYQLDELLFLPDVAWTEGQASYDWNGGAGRTYPDLPP